MSGNQRGSAMVLAMLVSVILTLLGISFLMMSRTENLIAQNEQFASQAYYAGESGVRAVKAWFDEPGLAAGFPDVSDLQRDLRRVDLDGAGPNPPASTGAFPEYKQTSGAIFDRPYRGVPEQTLLGNEEFPDVRISDRSFLDRLAETLLPGFPIVGPELIARFEQIDIYGPPYVETAPGVWTRYGVATVRVVAQIVKTNTPSGEQVVAERVVTATLNETPYAGPFGPLHSCGDTRFVGAGGQLPVYWGAVTSRGAVTLTTATDLPLSLPRSAVGLPRFETVWGFSESFAAFKSALPPGTDLSDPWFRLVSGGPIDAALVPPGDQPFPSDWSGWSEGAAVPGSFVDRSSAFQNAFVGCPQYPYDLWKTMAMSGQRGVRYFAWDADAGGTRFRENGRGPSRTFREITDRQRGLFFFDTRDGLEPEDRNFDGVIDDADNLTPPVSVSGGEWGFEGVIYLNATRFQADVNGAMAVAMQPPGEPFEDRNADGQFDPGAEDWIDLAYPTVLGGDFAADDSIPAQRADRGDALPAAAVAFRGLLYLGGRFEATGNARYYGSVVARQGVVQETGATGTPEIYWDQAVSDDWPPLGWGLPRVIVGGWSTGRR